jgi:hypothetical protein
MSSKNYEQAVDKFRKVIDTAENKHEVKEIITYRDLVISRYQPVFSLENISKLSEEDFRSFLYFENNRHWSGLFRHVTSLCADMGMLRETLAILLDSSRPLASRFDESVGRIKGLGKALATAILLVSATDKYGVWNNTSEAALKETNLWREFVRGRTPGKQYEQINKLLNQLAGDLKIDLWTLDALMWGVLPEDIGEPEGEANDNNHPVIETQKTTYSFVDDIQHEVLRNRLIKLSLAPLDTVIREAGVVFENYLRNKVDPNSIKHGVDLVEEAFKPDGKLIFSSHPGEQQGVQLLYRGAMQFIRNPPMHKLIDYPESMAKQFLRLIDSLMMLLDQATVSGEITVEKIRFMLRRMHIQPGQLELYRVLYKAGSSGLVSSKLAQAMQRTPQQLSGVLGALGHRINGTEGLENKGGISIVVDIKATYDGEWLYTMRPVLQKALEEEGIVLVIGR